MASRLVDEVVAESCAAPASAMSPMVRAFSSGRLRVLVLLEELVLDQLIDLVKTRPVVQRPGSFMETRLCARYFEFALIRIVIIHHCLDLHVRVLHVHARSTSLLSLPVLLLACLSGPLVLHSCCVPLLMVAADARACDSVHNSARNSRVTGGLLPVCKSTSYFLEVGRQGPTRRKGSKGGVSGPAEDLRHVSEVEAGVNFRPAGGVRG